jgi:23S rRNA (cytosine1962-C5)-methyltransferase
MNPKIIITEPDADYELIDSGDGEKLERFGGVVLRRPDPQAMWSKTDEESWKNANGYFIREGREGRWNFIKDTPERWTINFSNLVFNIRPSSFKHTGIFPEQAPNWEWTRELIKNKKEKIDKKTTSEATMISVVLGTPGIQVQNSGLGFPQARMTEGNEEDNAGHKEVTVLNLFGYTGGASVACAQAGAKVCHVDASKSSISLAKENAESSKIPETSIRWILDDAKAFVAKEIRRGNKYDGIIMDPPAFGRGPDGDVWQIEDDFVKFVDECKKLLSDKPLFFLVNGYASGYSQLAYYYSVKDLVEKFGGEVESGELTIRETKSGKLLPCGIFARWMSLR